MPGTRPSGQPSTGATASSPTSSGAARAALGVLRRVHARRRARPPRRGRRALELVGGLVEASLVVAEERSGATRYRLLETIAEFARERLDDSGARASAADTPSTFSTWQPRELEHAGLLARPTAARAGGLRCRARQHARGDGVDGRVRERAGAAARGRASELLEHQGLSASGRRMVRARARTAAGRAGRSPRPGRGWGSSWLGSPGTSTVRGSTPRRPSASQALGGRPRGRLDRSTLHDHRGARGRLRSGTVAQRGVHGRRTECRKPPDGALASFIFAEAALNWVAGTRTPRPRVNGRSSSPDRPTTQVMSLALGRIGIAALHEGRLLDARDLLLESVGYARDLGFAEAATWVCDGLALVAVRWETPGRAACWVSRTL